MAEVRQACVDGMHDACLPTLRSPCGCVCHGKVAPLAEEPVAINPDLTCVNTQCRVTTFSRPPAGHAHYTKCPACYGEGS